MELNEVLNLLGLDTKEAATYMAVLELGSGTVYSIAKKAALKRPTVYRILEELAQKGLVSVIPSSTRVLYTAESPEKLAGELRKKQEILIRFLPQFLALHNSKKDKPQVQLFEGKEAVRQIYHQLYLANEVWFFGSISEVNKIYPEEFKLFLERVKNKQLKARDLFSHTATDIEFAKASEQLDNYEIRFLPKTLGFAITDFAVSGENLYFFSFRPQIFAVAIKSLEVVGTFKTLYEFAWQSSAKNV